MRGGRIALLTPSGLEVAEKPVDQDKRSNQKYEFEHREIVVDHLIPGSGRASLKYMAVKLFCCLVRVTLVAIGGKITHPFKKLPIAETS